MRKENTSLIQMEEYHSEAENLIDLELKNLGHIELKEFKHFLFLKKMLNTKFFRKIKWFKNEYEKMILSLNTPELYFDRSRQSFVLKEIQSLVFK